MAQNTYRIGRLLGWALVTIVVATISFAIYVYQYWHQPIASQMTLEVGQGDTGLTIAKSLKAPRSVLDEWVIKVGLRVFPLVPLAGEYGLARGTTLYERMQKIARGEVVKHHITIPPGLTWKQIVGLISSDTRIIQDFVPSPEQLGLAHYDSPEGWFYPDTYQFSKPYRASQLIRRAVQRMKRQLSRAWDMRDKSLPLKDPYEMLILASIVEKETGRDDERAKVAGVFIARIRKGMRLQSDPTVIYGLGEQFDGDLRKADLQRDTPYNTYRRHGLPPTPIACPDYKSLLAVAQPDIDGSLYFVADGNGGHVFAKTLDEHNKNVRKYQLRK
ncbi:MAG: endolytic transglycosylase MltG [Gammaproteobacteria bacterium]|nr:MAG: endolytic transglycosylase MltG [Gammaproteobacteria bacterium]